MRLLRAADRAAVPWKNGGGVTREVAASQGAEGFDFDWRLSIAEVRLGGPFSTFPGVERALAVLQGSMMLKVAGRPGVLLDSESPPLLFPGDAATTADVVEPVVDLNLMTRRGAVTGRLEAMSLTRSRTVVAAATDVIVIALDPLTADNLALEPLDALHFGCGETVRLQSQAGPARIYVASLQVA